MREIKFRAWSKNRGYMTKSWTLFELIKNGAEWANIHNKIPEDKDFGDLIVMQYTGLKDKNGKEIYEGDIVIGFLTGNHPVPVDFAHGVFMVYWKLRDEWFCLYDPPYQWQVIGNIYENPELLKA